MTRGFAMKHGRATRGTRGRTVDLLLTNASQVLPMAAEGEFQVIEGGAVAVRRGLVVETGPTDALSKRHRARRVLDVRGRVVTPGLVDAHTHVVFAGSREGEFELRIRGATYQEIAAAGGGIVSTTDAVREAGLKGLLEQSMPRLQRMSKFGTTTAEAKSGYGLSPEGELEQLKAIRAADCHGPVSLVPTFLGAHAVPTLFAGRREEYVKLVTDRMIPEVARARLAEFCDVFCEKGAFTQEDTRKIFSAASANGLKLKIHADEFSDMGGGALAAEYGAVSADHLMAVSDAGIEAMRGAGVIAVLLPCTTFFLGLRNYAPARKILERGVTVALGTDCNPGSSMTESMQTAMTIACTQMRLTPAEALKAATINAARAIDRAHEVGSLEPGKRAHMVVWDVANYRQIPYHFGVNLVWKVFGKRQNAKMTGSNGCHA
jgi:imidazolonepropionase